MTVSTHLNGDRFSLINYLIPVTVRKHFISSTTFFCLNLARIQASQLFKNVSTTIPSSSSIIAFTDRTITSNSLFHVPQNICSLFYLMTHLCLHGLCRINIYTKTTKFCHLFQCFIIQNCQYLDYHLYAKQ